MSLLFNNYLNRTYLEPVTEQYVEYEELNGITEEEIHLNGGILGGETHLNGGIFGDFGGDFEMAGGIIGDAYEQVLRGKWDF